MSFRSGFVTDYLDPLQIREEIDAIVQAFPSLCRLETLPYKSHGYQGSKVEARGPQPMHVLRITAPGGATTPRPAVLLNRSHHAREWVNSLAIVETARQFVENYRITDSDPQVQEIVTILERVEILIIPETNPDGARLTFFDQGQRMWRKNLRPPASGRCPGVDCNRNFPRYFGEAGSSDNPCTEIYHGPQPLSEPETANIAHLVAQERTIIFAVDSHSYGQAIFRPSPNGGTYIKSEPVSSTDDAIYRHLEGAMNRGIKKIQGIDYSTGSTSNHAGTTDEYLFFNHHIFAFDLECATDFQPPSRSAVLAAQEVAEAVRALGRCAAGLTGLDVPALIAQRTSVSLSNAPPPKEKFSSAPWPVKRLPPEQWRRFLVHCKFKDLIHPTEEVRGLLEVGFDAHWRGQGPMEVIASSLDMVKLLHRGYQPLLCSDLFGDENHGDQAL